MSAPGDRRRISSKDNWGTPPEIFQPVNNELHFTLDVCADARNHKTERYFNEVMDGLTANWKGEICWMNPPFSNTYAWVKKAVGEAALGATVVALLPNNTDARWYYDFVKNEDGYRPGVFGEVFVRGRISFIDHETGKPKSGNTTGSVLVFFGHTSFKVESACWDWRNNAR